MILISRNNRLFKVTLALGWFSLFIYFLTFSCSPQYLYIAAFFTASFVVVVGVIAIIDLLKVGLKLCKFALEQ